MQTPHHLAELGQRVISLCDGRHGLRGGLAVDVREPVATPADGAPVATTAPVLDFTASNERLDRYDEIVVASGWVLDNYRRNPVFQNAHKYGDILFTLGKALSTEVKNGHLFQRVEFATEVNPMAKIAYGLYRGKFLNAVSVGFIPLRWENGGEGAGYRRKYVEQELLEVSAVGIPANPDALQLGLKAGAIERADVQHLLELLETLAAAAGDRAARTTPSALTASRGHDSGPRFNFLGSKMAAANTHACASGVRGYEAQLLQLARLAKTALRR